MPVIRQPNLSVLNKEQKEFLIFASIAMETGENPVSVVFNGNSFNVDAYTLDFSNASQNLQANIPLIRTAMFSLKTIQTTAGNSFTQPIYIVNSNTGQVIEVLPPTAGAGEPSIVSGSVPFFISPNQAVTIWRELDPAANCVVVGVFSFLTFEAPAFLTAMTPNAFV